MQLINTISLTRNVNDWLGKTRHPHILHIFDYVCNLINERGEILSIVTPKIGNGPFNLVIEDDVCFSEHLNLRSPISNSPRQLDLGSLTINTADAKTWNPRPNWEMLHARRADILTQLLSLSIPYNQASIPNSPLSNLSYALIEADIPTAKTVASQLAGLGQGLTPSGDDYLMGTIYAAFIIHPIDAATSLASEIAESAAPLTTSLSAAWLGSAGKGQAGVLWHEFFDALLSTNTGRIYAAIDKIIPIGETSGTDALAGFIDTIISLTESETRLCHS